MVGRDVRICFVGDSFVQGTCDPECLGWAGRVCRAAVRSGVDLTYYNLGVRRQTSTEILQRWRGECVPRLPAGCDTGVVFSFGNNDTTADGGATRVCHSNSISNAEALLREARALYRVVMIGPPPMLDAEQNRRTRQLCQAFGEVAAAAGVPYLPVFDRLLADPVWNEDLARNDGSHPGSGGYERLARLVLGWDDWWFR